MENVSLYYSDVNWQWVDEETKVRLELKSKDDGEFWMSYKDFCLHFSEVTICLLGPDFDGDGISDQAGQWTNFSAAIIQLPATCDF